MKWGVRRYQYSDGTYTPLGKKRYQSNQKSLNILSTNVSYLTNSVKTQITGKQYVDSFLKSGTTFARIQTSKNFENFAFYATYKKKDQDKYLGLFGKNLKDRANSTARNAEKTAKKTNKKTDIQNAKTLREYSNDLKVYQLQLKTTKKLKIPSDENAADITNGLMKKDKEFVNNVKASIQDSKEKMRRPNQRLLFRQAENALNKNPHKMTSSEKIAIYKALNLSLTNHNPQEVATQNVFYKELKKKGYNALLDYNDKEYSSYHAKRPMIVFDLDNIKLQSVTEANPKIVNQLYKKYNRERIRKEIGSNTIGYATRFGKKSMSECNSYVKRKFDRYLE